MRLVVDTSVLVGELLRKTGRERLADERLQLFILERMWAETQVELPRRISAFARRQRLDPEIAAELTHACLQAIEANVIAIELAAYSALESEARERCVRDPSDWPVVASALALSADIWTNDGDFLGTGVATWTTETLQRWLERNPLDSAGR